MNSPRWLGVLLLMAFLAPGCQESTPVKEASTSHREDHVVEDDADEAAPAAENDARAPALEVALKPIEVKTAEDRSILKWQKRIELEPERAMPYAELGTLWVRKARRDQNPRLYEITRALAEHALTLDAKHVKATFLLALVAQNDHDFAQVARLAQQILDRDPEHVPAWGLFGDAHLELGDMDKAIDAYQHMIDIFPGIPSYTRIAHVRWLHGDLEGALEMWKLALDAAAKVDPEPLAYCHTQIGHLRWQSGENELAEKHYAGALEVMPAYAEALLGKGRIAFANGRYEDAITHFEKSLAARKLEETYVWLLHAREANGQKKEAEDMVSTLREGSSFDDPRTLSLFFSSRSILPERALELAKQDARERGDIYTQDALAIAYLRVGDADAAARHISKALHFNTPDARILGHAGLIAAARKDPEAARAYLTKSRQLQPMADPDLAREITRTLSEIEGGQP